METNTQFIDEWNQPPNEMIVNGYNIKFNSFWHVYQVSHDEIGVCIAEFKTIAEAEEYCRKG